MSQPTQSAFAHAVVSTNQASDMSYGWTIIAYPHRIGEEIEADGTTFGDVLDYETEQVALLRGIVVAKNLAPRVTIDRNGGDWIELAEWEKEMTVETAKPPRDPDGLMEVI